MADPGDKTNGLKPSKEEISIKYMHRPPTITPNYGNARRASLPKSKVSRVLLYDNATQDHMLEIKLAHMNIEKERICRLINLHKRSFSMRQKKKYSQIKIKETENKETQKRLPNIVGNKIKFDTDTNSKQVVNSSVIEAKHNEIYDKASAKSGNIKLPDIHEGKSRRHLIFKMEDSTGITRIFQTEAIKTSINEMLSSHHLSHKLTDDPRFQSLESMLVPSSDTDIL